MSLTDNEIVKRAKAPTPKFFKKLRLIGLVITALGGSILAAPVALPAAVITAGGYVLAIGGVLTTVSQVTVEGKLPVPKKAAKKVDA
ncbi:hypothetical protein [Penaeicola halotolerans]|uniref:hypothetical protein n=1 Tax=Penaeicola halotolerans TaxID=2793196 RepID=UPI001CF8B8FE|nr:hypothetical protein [Penaeicola halotolerans]